MFWLNFVGFLGGGKGSFNQPKFAFWGFLLRVCQFIKTLSNADYYNYVLNMCFSFIVAFLLSKGKGIIMVKCLKLLLKLNLFWINYNIDLNNK